ncbi:DeoR/GlpR family DNA-binding transcription regulator [Agromyces sp. G08B096]|uniref:Lactose phosphotransferase system repressor n=1 Tax=Agromyces sp. G08B096 TaxID=3156399 RepID=A0AAU7W539_9MICO
MPAGRAPRDKRLTRVLEHVLQAGTASSAELASLTGVSLMTIHRDIDALVDRGLVRKFHGGVSALPSTVFESSSEFRMRVNTTAKEAIAREAVTLVEPGMSVLLDDSTTAYSVAELLPQIGPLTVVTNFRRVIDLLHDKQDIQLIALGGDYSRTHDSFLGVGAEDAVSALNVDVAFLSTSAMTPEMTFHQEQAIVQVKRPMMSAATLSVLLMDASKLARTALYRLAPTSAFGRVIIDDAAPADVVERIAENVDVHVAARQTA